MNWIIANFAAWFINIRKNISSTGAGVTGVSSETGFDILPDIDIKTTNIIIISFLLIYILKFWYKKSHEKQEKNKNTKIKELIQHCIFSNLIFFNFGYQVHEKAFLNISILTGKNYQNKKVGFVGFCGFCGFLWVWWVFVGLVGSCGFVIIWIYENKINLL